MKVYERMRQAPSLSLCRGCSVGWWLRFLVIWYYIVVVFVLPLIFNVYE